MARRRPVSNPLALVVLTFLTGGPMHPYEMAQQLKATGKELTVKISWGSLYTVVQNLQRHGFIEEAGTTRQGARPERTSYAITEAGRDELRDWLAELLAEPQKEFPLFPVALSLVGVLSPEEVIQLLRRRLDTLDGEVARAASDLDSYRATLPRIFLIEADYLLAMRRTEAEWVRGLLGELESGAFPDLDVWRSYHDSGEVPDHIRKMLDDALAAQNDDEEATPETD
jgi:DNA-binding PadR family transcriptional regulator